MKLAAVLLLIIIISACAPSPEPSRSLEASQRLVSAQATATIVAMSDNAAAQATAQAKAQRDNAIAEQTRTAYNATQSAMRSTEQANNATVSAITVQQQAGAATAQAMQNESAVAISINAATATARAVDQKARIDAASVTKQAAEINATITAIGKAQADDTKRVLAQQDDQLTFAVGWGVKIGAALLLFIFGLVVIEVIRKKAAVTKIGNYTVAVDGGAFGKLEAYLLIPDAAPPLMLPAPAVQTTAPTQDYMTVNGSRVVPGMSQEEFDDRKYWRLQMIRFLQDAIAATSSDYNRIPTYKQMQMQNQRWVDMTDTLGEWIDKRERQPTMCLPPYETLNKLLLAVMERRITPLPPYLRARYNGNSGKQATAEQETDTLEQQKQRENSAKGALEDAIRAIPVREAGKQAI